ncbi:succinylglutamate desuccinylase/aspartoacylase family protein [Thiohalocapsa sp.]|uniref:succinylglutamate desuccinylase/aspartoacylase family protein n=1 Tax=Thiohalocapsa sp. TaxID=2497641 RepID=UPI0025E48F62|nr:succinylglutamate desuccinylase/aspartoacylase family protein [Thiohalocapsa sp.]
MRRLLLIALSAGIAGATPPGGQETPGGAGSPRVAGAAQGVATASISAEPGGPIAEPFALLGETISPGATRRLAWAGTEQFEGVSIDTPVLVAHGADPGPVLCLTAAVHGDELNGIEIVRRVLGHMEPGALNGTVVGVPIVNIQAFRDGSRYLPDRRDLNRHFPGSPGGSAASRIAHSLFTEVVQHCDALVDLHTGSFERINLPQLRADLSHAGVAALARGFGATVVVNSQPREGTLRAAATQAGIPTVTFEAGGPAQLEPDQIAHGVRGVHALLNTLGMVAQTRPWTDREATYVDSSWVRADRGGILMSAVELGKEVREGDVLGRLIDPITNKTTPIHSPSDGRVIGMARNQVLMPGFAAYHLGQQGQIPDDRLAPPMPDSTFSDTSE